MLCKRWALKKDFVTLVATKPMQVMALTFHDIQYVHGSHSLSWCAWCRSQHPEGCSPGKLSGNQVIDQVADGRLSYALDQ